MSLFSKWQTAISAKIRSTNDPEGCRPNIMFFLFSVFISVDSAVFMVILGFAVCGTVDLHCIRTYITAIWTTLFIILRAGLMAIKK